MNFIGQSAIINDFSNKMKNNMLGHAYALKGPVGMGKRSLGRFLAQMLLCTEEGTLPCGQCRSCKSFEADSNPHFMRISAETQKILIKQIRGLIEDVSVKPSFGKKVYLIEDADKMTPDAQNCLLKTLEEPPDYAVILMTTAYLESLLITVRSRIVKLKVKPSSIDEIKAIVRSKGQDAAGKDHLLTWANGNPGKALQLLGDKKFEENRQRVMKYLFQSSGLSNIELNQYLSENKEEFASCMDILESVYRDALCLLCGASDGLINSDKQDNILEYAKKSSSSELAEKISKIEEIRNNLRHYMNYQLAVDMVTLV